MDAGQLAVASPSDPQAARWTTVGRPHDRAEWQILEGEICMRGDLVQERYWGEESGPYSSDGWAHMGDLGFVDEAGYLHVVGRVKESSSGAAPTSIRTRSSRCCACIQPCWTSAWSGAQTRARRSTGRVRRRGPDARRLDRFLNERGLARYKWPERIHRLHELPLSGPGKVNRRMLGEHARAL